MKREQEYFVTEAMEVAHKMLALADEAAGAASDADECGILLGVMRDCAYKIRREALRQSELQRTTEPRLR
jgi:hypothetical protein